RATSCSAGRRGPGQERRSASTVVSASAAGSSGTSTAGSRTVAAAVTASVVVASVVVAPVVVGSVVAPVVVTSGVVPAVAAPSVPCAPRASAASSGTRAPNVRRRPRSTAPATTITPNITAAIVTGGEPPRRPVTGAITAPTPHWKAPMSAAALPAR